MVAKTLRKSVVNLRLPLSRSRQGGLGPEELAALDGLADDEQRRRRAVVGAAAQVLGHPAPELGIGHQHYLVTGRAPLQGGHEAADAGVQLAHQPGVGVLLLGVVVESAHAHLVDPGRAPRLDQPGDDVELAGQRRRCDRAALVAPWPRDGGLAFGPRARRRGRRSPPVPPRLPGARAGRRGRAAPGAGRRPTGRPGPPGRSGPGRGRRSRPAPGPAPVPPGMVIECTGHRGARAASRRSGGGAGCCRC